MAKLRRVGVVIAAVVLTACSDTRSSTTAPGPGTSPVPQAAITTTTATPAATPSQPVLHIGQPFTLGDLRLTMLAVQDPFPPSPQVQPAPGNRLVSIRYEVVSERSAAQQMSDLPAVELRDPTGASYQSEHGRLSMVGGARMPGELPPGRRMETSAIFEVPASTTGLQAAFRPFASAGGHETVVRLD